MKHRILAGLMCLSTLLPAQTPISSQQIQDKADIYYKALPQEKAYVQLDKNYYLPGETVWMKAYVVQGYQHTPSELSNVLHVDLIDSEDRLIKNIILYIFSGEAVGEFDLPDDIPSGSLRIRAYTSWMRNFDSKFETSLQVLNPNEEELITSKEGKPDLQFLPEGGSWVAGISNQLAFKAIGPDGLGEEVSGEIKDGEGKVVSRFASSHLGMGKVEITPEAGASYLAEIQHKGSTYRYALPPVQLEGIGLAYLPEESNLSLRLQASSSYVGQRFSLTGSVRGKVLYTQEGSFEEGPLSLAVSTEELPLGIVQFTLFNREGMPLAERLVFNSKDEGLRVFVNLDAASHFSREAVEVDITVADNKGNPVETPLSMAVTHADGIWEDQPNRSTIYSQFWLSSDLKGFVEQPSTYFVEEGPGLEELDLVMRTHGWRGFDWEEILASQPRQLAFEPERGLSISGEAYLTSGEPLENAKMTLVIDNVLNTFITEADGQGRFLFPNMIFLDTTEVFLQARNRKNKKREVEFRMDRPNAWEVSPYSLSPTLALGFDYMEEKEEFVESGMQFLAQQDLFEGIPQYELGTVEITAMDPEEVEKVEAPGKLYGEADFSLDGDELPQNLTVSQALQGRVPGVNVFPGNGFGGSRISIRGSRNQPLFLLDGMPTDIGFLDAIPMPDIDQIDVIKGPRAAIYGGRGAGGLVAVYTKRGEGGGVPDEDAIGVIKTAVQGFHVPRIFYAPQYKADRPELQAPDLRSTLYWHPVIRTDKNGKAKLRFYTSDLTGEFFITVEGISPAGQPAYKQVIFEVE